MREPISKKMPEEQEIQNDPYLNSPREFILEMPLYHELDLSVGSQCRKIYDLLCYSGTIDIYCIKCGKESVFDTVEYLNRTIFSEWKKSIGFDRTVYRCTRNSGHEYYSYYYKGDGFFVKMGQFPSVADFQIPQAEKYRKELGEDQYKEFTRGIGLNAHGVGIGSFVYLRRIFENLIEEAHTEVKKDPAFSEENYLKGRMDEKIILLKVFLPEFLVENKNLYSILSKGIHDLEEEECLKYFQAVKIGIEQILDEKIEQKEKKQKAEKAREALQNIHRKVAL
ncbi:short-chain dehydrogenase [Patescibacteria group bacterium]|nr:short-chain dehydrogenase [Patescibacteria group bacterium]